MSLGSRIRYYRSKLAWTLEKLSEVSGVDVGTISALEVRNSVRSKFAPQLAAAFKLSVEQLLDETTDWLDNPYPKTKAPAPLLLRESAPASRAPAWPFSDIDIALVNELKPDQLAKLQGALLLAAAQIGIEIRKQAAA